MAVSLPPLPLDDHGENNDDPFQDRLVLRLDIPQTEDVVENAEGQGADHGADDRADAASKAGATDHHRGDGVELVAAAIDVAPLVHQGGVQQRGQPG